MGERWQCDPCECPENAQPRASEKRCGTDGVCFGLDSWKGKGIWKGKEKCLTKAEVETKLEELKWDGFIKEIPGIPKKYFRDGGDACFAFKRKEKNGEEWSDNNMCVTG